MSLFKKKPKPSSNDPQRPPNGPACDVPQGGSEPKVIVVVVKNEENA